jgi:DNA invertase Pin-like site-specific DNA recombinase
MPAAIYARQSLDQAKLGAAVERQIEECRTYAAAQGFDVVEEFVDNDVSATTGVRPAFTRLVAAIEAGEIDSIIVWHTDRLYRRVRDLVDLVDLAESRKLSIMSVRSGTLDLSTPSGRMLAGMLGHAARFEVEQKSIRQAAGIAQLARKGMMRSTRRLYGYSREGHIATVVDHEAKIVREMYKLFLLGTSSYRLAQILNERGITNSLGNAWISKTVDNMLGNPAYCGLSRYKGEIVGVGQWKPLISKKTFNQYLATQAERPARRVMQHPGDYFLSGLARCGTCGGKIGARVRRTIKRGVKTANYYYICIPGRHVSRQVEPLDNYVSGLIIDRLTSGTVTTLTHSQSLVLKEYKELEKLRAGRRDLASALAEGIFDLYTVRTRVQKIELQIAELSHHISDQIADDLILTVLAQPDIASHWHEQLGVHEKHRIAVTLMTVTVDPIEGSTKFFRPDLIQVKWR